MSKIGVVILAAGLSSRFSGISKPLLKIKNKYFIDYISEKYSFDKYVVLGYNFDLIQSKLKGSYTVLYNHNYTSGMFTSVQLAVKHLNLEVDGVIIHPVDYPLIKKSTIQFIENYASLNKDNIIVPSYKGKCAHPVYIPKSLFSYIIEHDESTLRDVIYEHINLRKIVDIDDVNMLNDIDNTGDYRRWIMNKK